MARLFYCFSSGAKNERNTKNAKVSYFFHILNIYNLLERACNDIKLYIYSENIPGDVFKNNIFSRCKKP